MKIKLILLMVVVALNASGYQVMDTSSGVISEKNDVAKPTKTVTTSENGYTVTYSFPELIISRDENGEYNCHYPDFGTSHELGFAALPFIGELYMIPEGSDVEVSIQDAEYTDYSLTSAPAQEIPVNSPDSDYVPAKLPITVSDLYLPAELAGDIYLEKYRGNTFARVRLTPMQYNSKERKLRVYTSITLNIEYAEDPDGLQAQSSAIEFEQFPDLLSIGDYAVKPARAATRRRRQDTRRSCQRLSDTDSPLLIRRRPTDSRTGNGISVIIHMSFQKNPGLRILSNRPAGILWLPTPDMPRCSYLDLTNFSRLKSTGLKYGRTSPLNF